MVFALAEARHTVVSPATVEHDRIRDFCDEHDVSLANVTFIVGASQDILPTLPPNPLDLVLIDGGHAFPMPFIDWYYSAIRLRVGGCLLLDDTHIRTGEILREFLLSDTERWRLVSEVLASAMFEKADAEVIPLQDWLGQPYCAKVRHVPGVSPPSAWQRLRNRVRLRSRLREAFGSGRLDR
ncbi:MAG: class I SAM-dependent methyltransferase [Actinomycetota bacterium]|nr:class I SAM-dependent methyltransferase [Actinomycetota bacterium]